MLKAFFSILFAASLTHAQSASFARTSHHQAPPVGQAELPVTIEVTGLKHTEGQLLFAVFTNAEGFPNDATPAKTLVIDKVTATTMSATMQLPAGTYAISFIADTNGNGKLDTGAFGIPSEGFGFSNNPSITFGAPKFNQCAVNVQSAHQVISIKAVYF